jgi:uncharacterized LabA/DUF88 family protein
MQGEIAMADEVAVLIDFENLRYGLLNNHGIEPDIMALVDRAKKYGRPTVMRAYADFSEHPEAIKRQLQIAGVEAIDIPVKKTTYTKGGQNVERIKNAADMVLALDSIIQAVDADANGMKKVFFIVAGDRDYIKLVTLLKNRFGQRVVICGVPGSTAGDLVSAAGEEDHIEIEKRDPVDVHLLKSSICSMVKKGPSPLSYWGTERYRSVVPRPAPKNTRLRKREKRCDWRSCDRGYSDTRSFYRSAWVN